MPSLTSSEGTKGAASGSDFRATIETGSAVAETVPATAVGDTQPFLSRDTAASPARRDERDAILRALYEDRSELVDREALGTLSSADTTRLHDLDREIARWERSEVAPETDETWDELERLAGTAMGLQAQIEAKTRSTK